MQHATSISAEEQAMTMAQYTAGQRAESSGR